jgi:hypothetical protein
MTRADMLAWCALVLAIAAIVLHVPLSMLAHHYLPIVEDSLASRSREKLTKRIAKLHRRLDQLNDQEYFDDLEWGFRESLFSILYLFGVGFLGLVATLFPAMGLLPKATSWLAVVGLLPALTACAFALAVGVAGWNMFKSSPLRPSKRSKRKSDIQEQIDALAVKLSEFGIESGST